MEVKGKAVSQFPRRACHLMLKQIRLNEKLFKQTEVILVIKRMLKITTPWK